VRCEWVVIPNRMTPNLFFYALSILQESLGGILGVVKENYPHENLASHTKDLSLGV
jgi:hypothetical protein